MRAIWPSFDWRQLSGPDLGCFGRSCSLSGCPGVQTRNPGTYRAPVRVIVGSELARQGWLLVEARRGCPDTPGHGCVLEEAARAEHQRLARQDHQESDVDGIAHVAVE